MYSFKLKLLLPFFLLAWLIMNLARYFQDYMCIQAVSFWGNALFFWLSNHIKDLLSNTSYLITAFTMTFFLINLINNNNNNANWCHCKTSCCWIIKDTGRNFKTTFKKSSIDFGMNNMCNMISFPPSSYPLFLYRHLPPFLDWKTWHKDPHRNTWEWVSDKRVVQETHIHWNLQTQKANLTKLLIKTVK